MKRFTDTDIWDKEWFMSLPPKGKLLIRFLFDKCDSAGVWSPNWPLASTYIGQKVGAADLKLLRGQVELLPSGKVFVLDFVKFQYGELTENCPPHRKIIAQLKFHNLLERVLKGYAKGTDTLTLGYRKGTDTLQDIDKDKEEDKEEEKEEDQDSIGAPEIFEEPPVVMPFESESFLNVWAEWKKYRKKAHKFQYATNASEQAALKGLADKAKNDEATAKDIVVKSMAMGWKGFFEPKNNNNNGQANTTGWAKGNNNAGSPQSAYSKISSMYSPDGQRGNEG